MNLVIFDSDDCIGDDIVRFKDRRFEHIKKVLGLAVGDSFRAGRLNGPKGSAVIVSQEKNYFDVRVNLTQTSPDPLPVELIIALPRPQTFKKVLEFSAAVGVKKIHVINSCRVEKSFWQSPVLSFENMRYNMLLGLEQVCDTILPEVFLYHCYKKFFRQDIERIIEKKKCFIAHPHNTRNCPERTVEPSVLAVGPEGGFIDSEVSDFAGRGFAAFNCGQRVFRVEHAVPVLLSKMFI